jgi:hypothetical protein
VEVHHSLPTRTIGSHITYSLNMSAYGAIQAPKQLATLKARTYPIKTPLSLTTYPLSSDEAPADLKEYLYGVFSAELEGQLSSQA